MENNSSRSSGCSFLMILQALFIAFKVAGFLDWNWWQVLIPGFIDLGLVILLALLSAGGLSK